MSDRNHTPVDWYAVGADGTSVLRVVPGLALGESETGALALNDADPTRRWIEFEADAGGAWLEATDRVAMVAADGAQVTRTFLNSGLVLRLPNNELCINSAMNRPAETGPVLTVEPETHSRNGVGAAEPGDDVHQSRERDGDDPEVAPGGDRPSRGADVLDAIDDLRKELGIGPPPRPAGLGASAAWGGTDARAARSSGAGREETGSRQPATRAPPDDAAEPGPEPEVETGWPAGEEVEPDVLPPRPRLRRRKGERTRGVGEMLAVIGALLLVITAGYLVAVPESADQLRRTLSDAWSSLSVGEKPLPAAAELDQQAIDPGPTASGDQLPVPEPGSESSSSRRPAADLPGSRSAPIAVPPGGDPAADVAGPPADSMTAAEAQPTESEDAAGASASGPPPAESSAATGAAEPASTGFDNDAAASASAGFDNDAAEAASAGDGNDAARGAPAGMASDPAIEARLARARALLEAGDITYPPADNAVDLLQTVLARHPQHPGARALLDECSSRLIQTAERMHRQGLHYEARNTLEEVLSFDRDSIRARSLLERWVGSRS